MNDGNPLMVGNNKFSLKRMGYFCKQYMLGAVCIGIPKVK